MPVPFEALLPYGILITMLTVTGAGLNTLRTYRNEGLQPRWGLDNWDRVSEARWPTRILANVRYRIVGHLIISNLYTPTNRTPVMERDRRMTGSLRGQSDSPKAPKGFELSSEWKVCGRTFANVGGMLMETD